MTEARVGLEDGIERFIVRKELATRHSEFIKKALDPANGWKEAKENIMRFPEEPPEAFQVFVTFLDTGVIHLEHSKSATDAVIEAGKLAKPSGEIVKVQRNGAGEIVGAVKQLVYNGNAGA